MNEVDKILKKAKKILQETDAAEFEIKEDDISIKIKRKINPKYEGHPKAKEKKIILLTSNRVGKVKFIIQKENIAIKRGDIICHIESLGISHEIRSQTNGTIKKYLVKNGAFIEYGVPLVEIEEK